MFRRMIQPGAMTVLLLATLFLFWGSASFQGCAPPPKEGTGEEGVVDSGTDKGQQDQAPEKKEEMKPEMKPEDKPEMKPEVKPEMKPEDKPEVQPEGQPEVQPETQPETQPEGQPESITSPLVFTSIQPNVAYIGQTYKGLGKGSGFKQGMKVEVRVPGGSFKFQDVTTLGATVTFKSSSEFTVEFTSPIPPNTPQGTFVVRVKNPGGAVSNPRTLDITSSTGKAPVISSLSPNTATRGQAYKGTVTGTGFNSGTLIEAQAPNIPLFGDIKLLGAKVTYKSSTSIEVTFASLPASLAAGTYLIRAANRSGPRNYVYSNTVNLTVKNQSGGKTPTLTSLTPNTATVNKPYKGTFKGTNFDQGAAVEIKAPILNTWVPIDLLKGGTPTTTITVTRKSTTEIEISLSRVPSSYMSLPLKGTHDVRITNPNGKSSKAVKLTIQ